MNFSIFEFCEFLKRCELDAEPIEADFAPDELAGVAHKVVFDPATESLICGAAFPFCTDWGESDPDELEYSAKSCGPAVLDFDGTEVKVFTHDGRELSAAELGGLVASTGLVDELGWPDLEAISETYNGGIIPSDAWLRAHDSNDWTYY